MALRLSLAGAFLSVPALLLAGACASSPPPESAYVTVAVEFAERSPQDVFLNVMLERVTESGERRRIGLSTQRLVGLPSPVVRVRFDPGDIDPTARYEVRASFDQQGTLTWDTVGEPVLTQGNPSSAVIRFGRRPDRWPPPRPATSAASSPSR
jgi:uncharacterized lipoprotein YbaY